MTTLNFPSKPSPVEPDPAEVLARLASTSVSHLYQREKRASVRRNRPKVEAAKAELAALYARLEAEEAEAKKGGRPRKDGSRLAGTGVLTFTRKERKVQGHGTNASYRRGCRCESCKAAKREYERAREAKRATRDRSERRKAPHHKAKGKSAVRRYTRTAA